MLRLHRIIPNGKLPRNLDRGTGALSLGNLNLARKDPWTYWVQMRLLRDLLWVVAQKEENFKKKRKVSLLSIESGVNSQNLRLPIMKSGYQIHWARLIHRKVLTQPKGWSLEGVPTAKTG